MIVAAPKKSRESSLSIFRVPLSDRLCADSGLNRRVSRAR